MLVTREALAGETPNLFLCGLDERPQLLADRSADNLGCGIALQPQSLFEVRDRKADARLGKLERALNCRDVVIHIAQHTRVRGLRRADNATAELCSAGVAALL